jgi:hypothetical protein
VLDCFVVELRVSKQCLDLVVDVLLSFRVVDNPPGCSLMSLVANPDANNLINSFSLISLSVFAWCQVHIASLYQRQIAS